MATRRSTQLRQGGQWSGLDPSGLSPQLSRTPTALSSSAKRRSLQFDVLTGAVETAAATPWLSGESLIGMPLPADTFRSFGGTIILSASLGAGRTLSVDLFAKGGGGQLAIVQAGFFGSALAATVTTPIEFGRSTLLHYLEEIRLATWETWIGLTLGGGDAAAGVTLRCTLEYAGD